MSRLNNLSRRSHFDGHFAQNAPGNWRDDDDVLSLGWISSRIGFVILRHVFTSCFVIMDLMGACP